MAEHDGAPQGVAPTIDPTTRPEGGEEPVLEDGDVIPGIDAEEDAEDASEGALVTSGPAPVIDRLRKAYAAQNSEERRLTIPIVPGRYGGDLAFRAKPIAYERFRKEADKAQRRGIDSAEAETAFAAKVIANACETILLEDGGDLKPAEEVVTDFNGTGPIVFDTRLCQVLGIPLPEGRTIESHTIARLVFRNKQAMQGVLRELLAFFSEETAGDDEDDADRPT